MNNAFVPGLYYADVWDIFLVVFMAVFVLSSEAQEIIRVCHRSLVMYHGRIAGKVEGVEMTEHNIMYLATGGSQA